MALFRSPRVTAFGTALLLCLTTLGVTATTSGAASAVPDRLAGPVATTTTVVMTAPEPMTVHVEVTLTAADGSTPSGFLNVVEGTGAWPTQQVTGTVTVFDQKVDGPGPREFRIVFYPEDWDRYTQSEGTATTTVAGNATVVNLSTEDLGGGVVRLSAVVDGVQDGKQVLFAIAGHDSVVGELGVFIGLDDRGRRHGNEAVVDIGGMAKGSYDVTATLDPGPTWAGSSDRETIALTKTKHVSLTFLYLTSSKRGQVLIETFSGAYYPKQSSGTITVKDVTTNKVVAVFRDLRNRQLGSRVIMARPGKHTYRAIFTPRKDLRTTVSGSRAQGTVTVKR